MKVVLNQETKEGKERTGKKFPERLGWLISRAAVAALVLLVAVQAAMLDPAVKSAISGEKELEGEVLQEEAYFYTPCKMEMKLLNIDSCPDLEVLVNGEKRAAFDENSVLLELKKGDVVELDASYVLVEADVQVSAVSSNIAGLLGRTMKVTDGINTVALVK
jgi:hypothetical protein